LSWDPIVQNCQFVWFALHDADLGRCSDAEVQGRADARAQTPGCPALLARAQDQAGARGRRVGGLVVSENSNVAMRGDSGYRSGDAASWGQAITAVETAEWARRRSGRGASAHTWSSLQGSSRSARAAVALEQTSHPLVDLDLGGQVWGRTLGEEPVPDALVGEIKDAGALCGPVSGPGGSGGLPVAAGRPGPGTGPPRAVCRGLSSEAPLSLRARCRFRSYPLSSTWASRRNGNERN